MQKRNEKNIFTYYSQYNRDLIECVYASATSSNMKKIFLKKYEIMTPYEELNQLNVLLKK